MSIRREITPISIIDGCECMHTNDDDRILLNVSDDIKLCYTFRSKYVPYKLIDMSSFDLIIDYFIKGNEDTKYSISKVGTTLLNCTVDNNNSILKSIFNKHGLSSGLLYAKFSFMFPDSDYPDKTATKVIISDTGITLSEN